MLIEDIKRIKIKKVKDVGYYDLHPKEQAEVDVAFAKWELGKYDNRALMRELYERGLGVRDFEGVIFELDAMADGMTLPEDSEEEWSDI